jgi:hypothetical protein
VNLKMGYYMALEDHSFIMETYIRETFIKVECKGSASILTKILSNGYSHTSKAIVLARNMKEVI